MLSDKLKKLNQPQTLDELFQSSKEAVLLEKVKSAVNMLIPQMKESLKQELKAEQADEINRQVSAIKVKDGKDGVDGKTPNPQEVAQMAASMIPAPKDGKDAVIDKNEIINEILKQIPRLRKGGGGGSTMRVDNLSSQVTGSTRSFTTTYKIGSSHLLFYSSFPTLFLPTTDYTILGNAVTLNSAIDFPVTGQSLAIIYEDAT